MERKTEIKLEPYIDNVIDHFSTEEAVILNAHARGDVTREEFLRAVEKYIKTFRVPAGLQEKILSGYTDFLWGYDILEPLIQAENITDIHCNSYNNIRVKQITGDRTVRTSSEISFESRRHYRRFVEHLAIRNKINLSEQNAQQNFVDKKSSEHFRLRCNITTGFLTCDEEPFLYIRKESKDKRELPELFLQGMFEEKYLNLIREAAQGPVIVCGESGSGKSILINAMIEEIPFEKNVLVLQADDELFAKRHPDVVAVHTVEPRDRGSIAYTFQDLARNAMLLDRDYLIFSEVKGKEAHHAFTAALTGHNPWLSLHAPTTRAAMYQFANYVKIAADLSLDDVFRMLAYTPFTLIHLRDFRLDGLTRVVGFNEERKEMLFEDLL